MVSPLRRARVYVWRFRTRFIPETISKIGGRLARYTAYPSHRIP